MKPFYSFFFLFPSLHNSQAQKPPETCQLAPSVENKSTILYYEQNGSVIIDWNHLRDDKRTGWAQVDFIDIYTTNNGKVKRINNTQNEKEISIVTFDITTINGFSYCKTTEVKFAFITSDGSNDCTHLYFEKVFNPVIFMNIQNDTELEKKMEQNVQIKLQERPMDFYNCSLQITSINMTHNNFSDNNTVVNTIPISNFTFLENNNIWMNISIEEIYCTTVNLTFAIELKGDPSTRMFFNHVVQYFGCISHWLRGKNETCNMFQTISYFSVFINVMGAVGSLTALLLLAYLVYGCFRKYEYKTFQEVPAYIASFRKSNRRKT